MGLDRLADFANSRTHICIRVQIIESCRANPRHATSSPKTKLPLKPAIRIERRAVRALALLVEHSLAQAVETIDTAVADIEAANRIAADVLMRSLDELPPQTCKLLLLIDTMLKSREKEDGDNPETVFFTRRALREFTGWGTTQIKLHLDRLQEHEYLATRTGSFGRAFEYELIVDVQGRAQAATVGLLDLAKLKKPHGYDVNLSGERGKLSDTCRATKNSPKAHKHAESVQPVGVSEMHKAPENRKAS
jgi:hypothetical protein